MATCITSRLNCMCLFSIDFRVFGTTGMLTFLWLWVLRNAFLGSFVLLPVTFALFLLDLSGAGPGTAVMQLDQGLEIVSTAAGTGASLTAGGQWSCKRRKGHWCDCAPMCLPKTTHPGAFQRSRSPRAHRRKSSQAEGWSQASLCSWSDSGPWGLRPEWPIGTPPSMLMCAHPWPPHPGLGSASWAPGPPARSEEGRPGAPGLSPAC